jgi:hypothetical protein
MMLVLGIDGGQRVLGWCIASFVGSTRRVIDGGDLREAEERDAYIDWLCAILNRYPIAAIGVEDHVWMGAEKSANPQAFSISKLVGKLEGAAKMWARCNNARLLQVFRITKRSCNASVGITGRSSTGANPKQRVKRATDAIFPGLKFKNEHVRDAAAVCVATRARCRL